jgi:hypothetical protein
MRVWERNALKQISAAGWCQEPGADPSAGRAGIARPVYLPGSRSLVATVLRFVSYGNLTATLSRQRFLRLSRV